MVLSRSVAQQTAQMDSPLAGQNLSARRLPQMGQAEDFFNPSLRNGPLNAVKTGGESTPGDALAQRLAQKKSLRRDSRSRAPRESGSRIKD